MVQFQPPCMLFASLSHSFQLDLLHVCGSCCACFQLESSLLLVILTLTLQSLYSSFSQLKYTNMGLSVRNVWFEIYSRWSVEANKQTAHTCNGQCSVTSVGLAQARLKVNLKCNAVVYLGGLVLYMCTFTSQCIYARVIISCVAMSFRFNCLLGTGVASWYSLQFELIHCKN